MTRFWSGLFLLAASWVFGTDYFYAANWLVWAVCVGLGVALIVWEEVATFVSTWTESAGTGSGHPTRPAVLAHLLIVLMLALGAVVAPWPIRAAPLLTALGMALALMAFWTPRLRACANGLTLAGVLFWVQALALLVYRSWTARSHELPVPFAWLLAGVAHLLDVDAALEKTSLMLPTMRQTHALGATWELFVDPPTWCFLIAALLLLIARAATDPKPQTKPVNAPEVQPVPKSARAERRRAARPKPELPLVAPRVAWTFPARWRPVLLCLMLAVIWLSLRTGLLVGVYLHRALRTDYEAPLNLLSQFWNPWLQVVLLVPLVWLHAKWLARPFGGTARDWLAVGPLRDRSIAWPAAYAAVAALCLTLGVVWDPIGERQRGRIAVDEFHSKWEPTDRPFDTTWYGHLSGYNYACIYDYCSRYYQMSRITNALTDAALRDLDVLIVKVPTERYALEEIGALDRFVERGGGLLLVGEHTDVFGTGYNLNAMARRFGFVFRYDCLFGIDSFFDQYYVPSFVPHPVVQHVRGMDFATSCSIEPLGWHGRSVITGTGLKNSLADYHVSNYYPPAVDHAAMRYGAFVQLFSVRHGRGRVLGFTDSTIFSNFSTFEPGKAELMLGMLEWLNHRDGIGSPRPVLFGLGFAALVASIWRVGRRPSALLASVAVATAAWSLTCLALVQAQRHGMPPPVVERPFVRVTIDRTACEGPLSKNGFIDGRYNGFGIFERWILRLGYFNRRSSGLEALNGDLVVFCYPTKKVSLEFRDALTRYVKSGGRVLILDSPNNTNSTATALSEPFKLTQRAASMAGKVTGPKNFPSIPVEMANEVVGGIPVCHLDDKLVGAVARVGKGTVTLIGFGSRFTDAHMGITGDVEPNDELKQVFEFQYALVRAIVEDTLAPADPPPK